MVEKVGAGNSVISELEPGVSGVFHLVRPKKGAILVAFRGDNGRGGDDIAEIVRQLRKQKRNMVRMSAIVSILAPLTLIGAMIPFVTVPVCVYYLVKPLPTEEAIRAAIAASAA